MWIDTNRLRFEDFDPTDLDGQATPEESEEFFRQLDERERDEQARREAMEREQAAMDWEATEDYPF